MFHRLPQPQIGGDRERRDNLDKPRRGMLKPRRTRPRFHRPAPNVLASLVAPGQPS